MTSVESPGLFRKLLGLIPNVVVLSCLIGALYWGHKTHWSFGGAHEAHASAAVDSAPEENRPHVKSVPQPKELAEGTMANTATEKPAPQVVEFDSPADLEKAGLKVDRVEEREMDEYIAANGVVTYDQTRLAQLSVRVPGIVWRVEKQVGQFVRKGDVLVILDSVEVGRAKADFLQSVVHYDLNSRNLSRLKAIRDSVPERMIREAEADVREARVTRFNAQQTLTNLGLPVDLTEVETLSDEELTQRVRFLGLPESLVQNLDQQKATANLIPLIAPFDGMVIGRELVVGEVVEPTHPQFTLADVRKMWLLLNVDREDASRVNMGQDVVFNADGVPRECVSRINWISTEVDQKTRTMQVRAEVENPLLDEASELMDGQRLLRANVFGTGRIRVKQRPRAIAAPGTAVHIKGARRMVFLPRSDGLSFEPREVRTGISQGGFTEVLTGLVAGDRVVTTGSYMLKSELFGSVE